MLETERALVHERERALAQAAELKDRLEAAERKLSLQGESLMAAVRALEERFRSASVAADTRLSEAEAVLSRLQRLIGDPGGRGQAFKTTVQDSASTSSVNPRLSGSNENEPARMDALFLEMSYAFRGSREEIKGRVSRYLPEVVAAVGQGLQRPILDIGCGRGEWMEVMSEGGVAAKGVDTSSACVALCVDRGLCVTRADAVAALEETPDGMLGGVSALHVVEHMPFSEVVHLLDEAHRCIASGGILLLETPNPESLMVGGRTFFFDPTHRMPIPPDVLALVVRDRGFTDVRVERLHPYPDAYQLRGEAGEAERVLNQLLYGPQDYCIVARRP